MTIRDFLRLITPEKKASSRLVNEFASSTSRAIEALAERDAGIETRVRCQEHAREALADAIDVTQKQFADLARECMDRADRELKFQRESYRASHDSLNKRIVDLEKRLGIPTPLEKAMQPMAYLPDQPEEDE